jgi:hypothetical protein
VHLDERGHPERLDAVEQRVQRVLLQRGDDQQHQVGAVRPRLVHLVRADHEVLAQHRDVHHGAHGSEVGERSAEPALLGEHADHARPAFGIGRGEVGGVGDGRQVTLRRAAPLHLGDHADARGPERGHHVPRRRGRRGAPLDLREVDLRLAHREIGPDTVHDGIEDTRSAVRHGSCPPSPDRAGRESC